MSYYSDIILATSGLIAYWRLGETSGTVADNLQGNATYDGTYTGTFTLGATGPLTGDTDKALHVAGGYVTATGLTLSGSACSLEVWLQGSTFADTSPLSSSTDGSAGAYIYVSSTDQVDMEINGTSTTPYDTAGGIQTGWHHLVGTYDGANIRMYYDGALVGGPTAKTGTLTGAGSIKIGQYGFPSGTGITGDLDEAAVYNVALSAATVSAHYAARLGATGPTTPGWTLGVKIV